MSALIAGYLLQQTAPLGLREAVGFLLILALTVLAQNQTLQLPGVQASLTMSGLTIYAAFAVFEPFYAAALSAGAVLASEALFQRKPVIKWLFNTSQIFVSAAVGATTYYIIRGSINTGAIPEEIPALTGAVAAYFVVNTFLVSVLLSFLNRASVVRIWLSNYRWELVYVAGTIPLALLLVLAYERLWLAGPLLFIAPLLLLRESYAQYIRLKTTYTETVRTLIKVIETHDTYTAGHSLRVAEYARRLAVATKLSVKEVEKIEIAAYLHDLGKVDLAITHLVRKPGRLTPEEKRRVQLHPLVSADLAAQVTFFRGDIENIIRHHHEHYNGTGYPHGLSGNDIPVGSRIILIADAFDAMTSNRMYRSALDVDRVKAEFRKFSRTQFDPDLVDVFLNLCFNDESFMIPQIEIAYDDLLSTRRVAAGVAVGE